MPGDVVRARNGGMAPKAKVKVKVKVKVEVKVKEEVKKNQVIFSVARGNFS